MHHYLGDVLTMAWAAIVLWHGLCTVIMHRARLLLSRLSHIGVDYGFESQTKSYRSRLREVADDGVLPHIPGVLTDLRSGLKDRPDERKEGPRRAICGEPADGVYTFYLTSDDGSELYIGDKLLIDNRGVHGMREVKGAIALKAGKRPLALTFFQGFGGHGLRLALKAPTIAPSKRPIPSNILWHAK